MQKDTKMSFCMVFFKFLPERDNVMKKTERFAMRLTTQDKEAIKFLAEKLGRSESDALCIIAREAAQALKITSPAGNPAGIEHTAAWAD